MYINDGQISQIIKGIGYLHIFKFGYNLEIFYTNIYSELSFKHYLTTQIYTHTRTHFATPLITNIFHMTMHKY